MGACRAAETRGLSILVPTGRSLGCRCIFFFTERDVHAQRRRLRFVVKRKREKRSRNELAVVMESTISKVQRETERK